MHDLGKRIGLIHELRKLARAEELPHSGCHRLGVDQITRHRGLHLLMDRHLLLDRALHALETDTKLIFQQLAHRAHTPVSQVIDVVRLVLGRVLAHLQNIGNYLVKVFSSEQWIRNAFTLGFTHLDVEFQPPNAGEIELARIEEHGFEQPVGSLHGRRIAGPHLAINLQQRVDRFGDDVFLQCLRENRTNVVALREKDREALDSDVDYLL